MSAVRTKPGESDRPSRRCLNRIDRENVLAVVPRLRVIGLVHGDRLCVVVDRDVDRPPDRSLDPRRRAAAPGEVVDNQLPRHESEAAEDRSPHAAATFARSLSIDRRCSAALMTSAQVRSDGRLTPAYAARRFAIAPIHPTQPSRDLRDLARIPPARDDREDRRDLPRPSLRFVGAHAVLESLNCPAACCSRR